MSDWTVKGRIEALQMKLDMSRPAQPEPPELWAGVDRYMAATQDRAEAAPDRADAAEVLNDAHSVVVNVKYLASNWIKRQGYFCRKCGAPEVACYSNEARLRDRQLCFSCNFWEEKAEQLPGKYIIINHTLYSDAGHQPNTNPSFLGFAGRLWHIQMNDGRTIVTNNLWTAGRMPHEYWERFPDNAKFVQEEK